MKHSSIGRVKLLPTQYKSIGGTETLYFKILLLLLINVGFHRIPWKEGLDEDPGYKIESKFTISYYILRLTDIEKIKLFYF